MQVICDRCNAEYEFEEALVSSGGTTVKCTKCGHLFKVYRTRRPRPSMQTYGRPWMVRYANGTLEELPSLKEITKQIRTGRLGPFDEISRTGRAFRPLGEIRELQTYLDEARRSSRGMTPVSERAPSVPADFSRPSSPEMHFDDDQLTNPHPRRPLQPQEASPPISAGAALSPRSGRWSQRLVYRFASKRNLRLLAICVVSAVGLGVFVVSQQSSDVVTAAPANDSTRANPAQPQPLRELLPNTLELSSEAAHADRLLASHNRSRFAKAAALYESSPEFKQNDAHVLSSLARLHARWSQALAFELADIHGGYVADPNQNRNVLREGRRRHAVDAKTYAQLAARKNPGNREAEVALADALRLAGLQLAAREELDRAQTKAAAVAQTADGALDGMVDGRDRLRGETLRVAALLAVELAGGDLTVGEPLAREAATGLDCGPACTILWFRTLLASGRMDEAQQVYRALAQQAPELSDLAYLKGLMQWFQDAAKTGSPEDEGSGKGAARSGVAPASPEASTPQALCREAQEAFDGGQADRAAQLFARAQRDEPGLACAETGLGYAALRRGDYSQALTYFRSAKKKRYPRAYIGLGDAYRAIERFEEAMNTYRSYLELFPAGKDVALARRQLVTLGAYVQAIHGDTGRSLSDTKGSIRFERP